MNYNTIVQETINEIPEFGESYTISLEKDDIDSESGPHTVFSFVFVPLLKKAMTNNKELVERMYAFLEKMECSGNSDVAEVVEFTVLEELCDEYRDSELEVYLQPETRLALKAIRKYMPEQLLL